MLSRARSPKNNQTSLGKLNKPKKNVLSYASSKEKLFKNRPLSYNKKAMKSEISTDFLMPGRNLADDICKKKHCGCHEEFSSNKKVGLKARKRPVTHLATEPMCF